MPIAFGPSLLIWVNALARTVRSTGETWPVARSVSALGHEVRLMPPVYVKAYLRRQKNDAADAEAICEAVRRQIGRAHV